MGHLGSSSCGRVWNCLHVKVRNEENVCVMYASRLESSLAYHPNGQ